MPATPPATDTDMRVRAFMAWWLRNRGETKADLGRAVGLTPWQLNRRFMGTFPFQAHEIVAIAEHCGLTVQEILDGLPDTQGE
jgi:hypothetical protein